ncbi:MAG TPA: glycoside hydrolase family 2 protein [Bacilli bacterium]
MPSRAFAKYVWLELANLDGVFSDNCLDLSAGEQRTVYLRKNTLSQRATSAQLARELLVYSAYDIAE